MQPASQAQMGQLLDPHFYQNLFHSAMGCCTSRSRDRADTGEQSNIGAQMFRGIGFPDDPIKVDLDGMAKHIWSQVQPKIEQPPERKVPVWEQDPAPLPGWSQTDQRLFIIAAKEAKLKTSQEASRLRRKLEKISRNFPGKSVIDCERCFRHVEASRIAYFGPSDA